MFGYIARQVMSGDYDSHATYIEAVEPLASRRAESIGAMLREAFHAFVERRTADVVIFASMSAEELARAMLSHPEILKPLLSVCNLGGRAVERDLDIRGLDTYHPRLDRDSAFLLPGYMKPYLPPEIELNSLVQIDRVEFIDKEIRASKGRWEKRVRTALNAVRPGFKKRKFVVDDEEFEIDAAWPETGDVQIGIDVKRIEARRDIHKRCDEIINKASKFSEEFPEGHFAAVIYYPFVAEHQNVRSRLTSSDIKAVYFAGSSDEGIATAVEMLLAELGFEGRQQ